MSRLFTPSQWTTVTPATGWRFATGAFLGDARADLLAYYAGNGTLWVARNDGAAPSFGLWATVAPATGWQFTVGDFTGGTASDAVGYHSNGTIWVFENLGSSFQYRQWATVSPASGWQFGAGYFTGGTKADLFGYYPGNGSLWVGRNTGTGFAFQQWGSVPVANGRQFAVGDVTGTGRADVVGYDPNTGALTVYENTGSSFLARPWGAVSPAAGWTIDTGYFTNRGKVDLFAYHTPNGSLWVGENTGTAFQFQQWGTAVPATGWQFSPGQLDGDGWVDLVGYHPSNGSIWQFRSTPRPIEGYCWPLSAAPGETISFRTSGGDQSTITYQRHTSTSPAVSSVTLSSVSVNSPTQPVPPEPYRVGCGWNETFSLTIPATWSSGFYSAECLDANGGRSSITFLVKPDPAQRSQVALLANANTWLAYNGWGGQSKYSGLARTSFLRPNPGAAPTVDLHLTRGELWVHGWLQREGFQPDVYTDLDFHNNGCDPAQYSCLVVSTHPEYWTTQMYDNLLAYLNAGGSLVYLGANGIFERCAYQANQTEGIFREGVEGGPRGDALFRVITPPRPERSVLGVATERCSVPGSPYQVVNAAHPLFSGTGLSNGSLFGQAGLNTGFGNGKASAWEVDTSNGAGAIGLPWDCGLTDTNTVPPSTLPAGLTTLARGQHDGIGVGADLVYYDHPGGGMVFSAGSLTFGGALVVDPAMNRLVRNALARAGVTASALHDGHSPAAQELTYVGEDGARTRQSSTVSD